MVCELRPDNVDPHWTRITIEGNRIFYPGDVGTPKGSLELIKLIINSFVSRRDTWFITFYIKHFYMETTIKRSEYAHITLLNTLQEFIDEYDLITHTCDGWIYF